MEGQSSTKDTQIQTRARMHARKTLAWLADACSGTTGKAKGVVLSHRSVMLHAIGTTLGEVIRAEPAECASCSSTPNLGLRVNAVDYAGYRGHCSANHSRSLLIALAAATSLGLRVNAVDCAGYRGHCSAHHSRSLLIALAAATSLGLRVNAVDYAGYRGHCSAHHSRSLLIALAAATRLPFLHGAEMRLHGGDVWGHFAPLFHLVDAFAVYAITLVGGRHVTVPMFAPLTALLAIGAWDTATLSPVPKCPLPSVVFPCSSLSAEKSLVNYDDDDDDDDDMQKAFCLLLTLL